MNPSKLSNLMDAIANQLPDHPVSVNFLCVKHSQDADYDISSTDVKAALLYLNEEGRIYFDEVGNVLRRPERA